MNIIQMKNWSGFSSSLILSISIFFVFCLTATTSSAQHQLSNNSTAFLNLQPEVGYSYSSGWLNKSIQDTTAVDEYPDPKSVMYKSMIIPGWGQIVNKQIWKVPIVYGMIGGLAGYSVYLHKRYNDYRAAYYNLHPDTPDDMRFGSTPDYIPESASLEALRSARNSFRNRRDMVYIGVVLAYGLNVLDAYVFAHMRSFDVSEDLSMRTRVKPSILDNTAPGLSVSIDLIFK